MTTYTCIVSSNEIQTEITIQHIFLIKDNRRLLMPTEYYAQVNQNHNICFPACL